MRGKKHHVSVCVCAKAFKNRMGMEKKEQTMINQLKIMTNAPD